MIVHQLLCMLLMLLTLLTSMLKCFTLVSGTYLITCWTHTLLCLECYFDIQDVIYYLRWFSSVLIPLLCIVTMVAMDYMMVM